jgi:predicted DNA-binding protein YlxM (UPF0122 family)
MSRLVSYKRYAILFQMIAKPYLTEMYLTNKFSASEIAQELACSENKVHLLAQEARHTKEKYF